MGAEPDEGATRSLIDALRSQAEVSGGGRSLGQDHLLADAVDDALRDSDAAAVAASACRAIATVVAEVVPARHAVYLAGGGVHNQCLMLELGEQLGGRLHGSTGTLGVGPGDREAAAMAVLTAFAADGEDRTLPRVTGRTREGALTATWSVAGGRLR